MPGDDNDDHSDNGDNGDTALELHETSAAALTGLADLIERLPGRITVERSFGTCAIAVAPGVTSRVVGGFFTLAAAFGLATAAVFGGAEAAIVAALYAVPTIVVSLVSAVSSLRIEVSAEGVSLLQRPVPLFRGGFFTRDRVAGVEVRNGDCVVLELRAPSGVKVVATGLDASQADAFAEVLHRELTRLARAARLP